MLVTLENFESALRYFDHQPRIIVDVETTGLKPYHGDKIIGIVCCANGRSYYFPYRHVSGNLPMATMEPLLRLLSYEGTLLINHNIKFDFHMMANERGFTAPRYAEDTQIAAHLMNENEPSLKLKMLADKYVDPEASLPEVRMMERLRARNLDKGQMAKLTATEAEEYASQDGIITEKLYDFYQPFLSQWRLADLFKEVNDYQMVTWRMERRGIKIDRDLIVQRMDESDTRAGEIYKRIRELAGYDINVNSPRQLCEWLDIKSTRRDVLDLMEDSEAAKLILDWRHFNKVNGTFYRRYLADADHDGIIHCSIRITGTVTGRCSCADPNLQQVPGDVREVFIPRDGYEFVDADYSQAEYRVAAHYAQERSMIEAFLNKYDFHKQTAEQVGVSRKIAKVLNFAILYGMGPNSLARKLNITRPEAELYLAKYHKAYPNLKMLMQSVEMEARRVAGIDPNGRGYIRLHTGRVRHFNKPVYNPYTGLSEPEFRKAGNSLIQGTVAEIVRPAITRIDKELLPRFDAFMLLQVHDSILSEVEKGYVRAYAAEKRRIMEDCGFTTPPMTVDLVAGSCWGKGVNSYEPLFDEMEEVDEIGAA